MFHFVVTLVVLVVAAILTAGYVDTCQNLHEEVRYVGVRKRLSTIYIYLGVCWSRMQLVNVSCVQRGFYRRACTTNHCLSVSQYGLGCATISGEEGRERATTTTGSRTTAPSTGESVCVQDVHSRSDLTVELGRSLNYYSRFFYKMFNQKFDSLKS